MVAWTVRIALPFSCIVLLAATAVLAQDGATAIPGLAGFGITGVDQPNSSFLAVHVAYDASQAGNPWQGGIYGYGPIDSLGDWEVEAYFFDPANATQALSAIREYFPDLHGRALTGDWTRAGNIWEFLRRYKLRITGKPIGVWRQNDISGVCYFNASSPLVGTFGSTLDRNRLRSNRYLRLGETYYGIIAATISYTGFNHGWYDLHIWGPVQIRIDPDISLAIAGPDFISLADNDASFSLTVTGLDKDSAVDTVNWTFSYRNRQGGWVDFKTTTFGSGSSSWGTMRLPRSDLDSWLDMASQYGEEVGGVKQLSMRVVARAYESVRGLGYRLLNSSNVHEFLVFRGIDVSLAVSGPNAIYLGKGTTEVVFKITGSGRDVGKVSSLVWNFTRRSAPGKDEWVRGWYESQYPRPTGNLSDLKVQTYRFDIGTYPVEWKLVVKASAGRGSAMSGPHYIQVAKQNLSLQITGPAQIGAEAKEALFSIQGSGTDLGKVKETLWIILYQVQGQWDELNRVEKAGLANLRAEGDLLASFFDLAGEYGKAVGTVKQVQMKMVAEAYSDESGKKEVLARSNEWPFLVNKSIETFGIFPRNLSLDVYPTEPNSTTISVVWRGTKLTSPIQLGTEGLPAYLNVSFSPKSIQPTEAGESAVKVQIALDPTRGVVALPAKQKFRITATSGGNRNSSEVSLNLLPAEWVVMLYLCADTDPDLEDPMLYNVLEMCRVSMIHDTPKVGMVVLVDLRFPRVFLPPVMALGGVTLPANNAQLYQVLKGNLSKIGADWGASNLSSKDVLERFLKESMKRFPSKHTHLIIADHGEGIKGAEWDLHQGNKPMLFGPMEDAFGEYRFDVLSFDACYMAQLEVLEHLKDHVDFFTCSELPVPGYGHAYEKFLANLTANPGIAPVEYVKAIVKPFGPRYDGSPGSLTKENATLSAIDSSKIDGLVSAVRRLADALNAGYLSRSEQFNRSIAEDIYKSWEAGNEPYTDIRDMANNLLADPRIVDPQVKAAAEAVIRAVDAAVLANTQKIFDPTGGVMASGFYGVAVLIWRKGFLYGNPAGTDPWDIYQDYLGYYNKTSFATNGSWLAFMNHLALSYPANVTTLVLLHPGHELYLHVYDSAGRHVGFNASSPYRTMLDTGIPGAMYEDFRNGTKVLLLPGGLEDFRVVVGGQYMEEGEESYTLSLTVIRSGLITSTQSLEGVIRRNTTHSTPIEIQDGALVVGETVVEGEPEKASLPEWFTRLFPLLVPVVEPVLPYVPSGLVPFVPFLALLLPVLVVVLVVGVVLRSRRVRAKSKGAG